MNGRQMKDTVVAPLSDDELVSQFSPRPIGNPGDAARRDADAIIRRYADSMKASLSKLTLHA